MAEMMAEAGKPGDVGAAEGAVEPEQRADAGALLALMQRGDQRALGALGHQRTVQLRRELEQRVQREGAGAAHLVEEAGEVFAPARRDRDLRIGGDVALQQRLHPRRGVRLAVRRALELEIALGRLGEEDAAVGADDRDGGHAGRSGIR